MSDSNRLKQSYFRGFIDVSGDISIQNNQSLKIYDGVDIENHQFSINSNEISVFDSNSVYQTITTDKLIHIKDLSENVQNAITSLTNKTENISLTDNSMNINTNVGISGSLTTNGIVYLNNDIIPTTDSVFDIGSPEYRIRDLYVSNNSIWVGDENKIGVSSDGNIQFQKRNKNVVPSILRNLPIVTKDHVRAFFNITDISTLKLNQWLKYARSLDNTINGIPTSDLKIQDLYSNNKDDFEYEQGVRIGEQDISFNSDVRVDICGNLYAQYPDNSIPVSAIDGELGGSSLSVSTMNGDTVNKSFTNINSIRFDEDSGFDIDDLSNGAVKVKMNSTFKYWKVDGQNDIVAEGLDSMTFVAGDNIDITTSQTPKSLTFSVDLSGVDASLNLKADLNAPTFIGNTTIDTLTVNNDVDVCGNFYAQYPDGSIPTTALIGEIGIDTNSDLSLNSNFLVNGTTTLSTTHITGKVEINSDGASGVQNIVFADDVTLTQIGETITGVLNPHRWFGHQVAMNHDGTIVAGSARNNAGQYTEADGNSQTGTVNAFKYVDGSWVQLGQTIFGENAKDYMQQVAINGPGNILVCGSGHNSDAGNAFGSVRVFQYDEGTSMWVQMGGDIDGTALEQLGNYVDINYSGDTIIVTAPAYQNSLGRYKVYTFINSAWSLLGNEIVGLEVSEAHSPGCSINNEGNIVAIGIPFGNRTATNERTGEARVYKYNSINDTWDQLGVDIEGPTGVGGYYGTAISLNSTGKSVIIGSYMAINLELETSQQNSNGLVEVFDYNEDTNMWVQKGTSMYGTTITLPAISLDINATGDMIIIGSGWEQNTDSVYYSGGISVYKYINDDWVMIGNKLYGSQYISLGYYVSMDDSGTKFCAGAIGEDNSRGSIYVYEIPHTIESSGTQLITNCDVSMNEQLFVAKNALFESSVDICGNFRAQYPDGSIPTSALLGEVGIDTESDLSLNAGLSVAHDVSFNSNVHIVGDVTINNHIIVSGDASFNSDVDICGNFRAQYPDESIPSSAIIGGGGGGGSGDIGVYVTKEIEYDDSDFAIIKEDKNTVTVTDYSIFISNEAKYDADGFATIRKDRQPVIPENIDLSGNFDIAGILSVTGKLRGNPTTTHIDTTYFKQF